MPRISKEPDVRKAELIAVAERLFIERGYDETAVSDIVKAANVAQGTFYYYFKTKDDVRNAIIDNNIEEIKAIITQVVKDNKLNAFKKMKAISKRFQEWSVSKGRLMDYLHEEKNEILHYRMSKQVTAHMQPAYQVIIEQGNKEGIFHADHPREASIALLALSESLVGDWHGRNTIDPDMLKNVHALLEFTEYILGTKHGLFLGELEEWEGKQ